MQVETLEQTFFGVLEKKIQERLTLKKEYLLSGAPEDYANYRENVGAVRELEDLLYESNKTLKAFSPY